MTHPLPRRLDPGKVRSFQRATSHDGFFLICAVDHLHDFAWLLSEDLDAVSHEQIVRAKDVVVRAAATCSSAILIDALYGIGHLVDSGAVPGEVGLITAIEDEGYTFPEGPRTTTMRRGWSIAQSKLAGVDIVKILWFYRPDAHSAADQRALLSEQIAQSDAWSIPLVVEPIWYPLPGEDADSEEWRQARYRGIVESAVEVAELGADMLKVEFPGRVGTPEDEARAAEACRELDSRVDVPWVVLSAGVGFEDFATQIRIACAAGASGYMAGRSIWREAVQSLGAADTETPRKEIIRRFEELNAITRSVGRPYRPGADLDTVLRELPTDWYHGWHPVGG